MMRRRAEVQVPAFLCEQARALAAERSKRNASNPDPYYYRPRAERLDYLGVLGELLVRWWCDTTGTHYEAAPLLAPHPVHGWDLRIDGRTFDVKTTESMARVYVNERAHNRKPVDAYLFVHLHDGVGTIYEVPYTEVTGWKLERLAFTPARVWTGHLS